MNKKNIKFKLSKTSKKFLELNDAYWGEIAKIADKEKSLGKKASMDFLQQK